ncbi:MAG: aldehyde dehydrogenase, partial [Alphaproteobacteria bacterium]
MPEPLTLEQTQSLEAMLDRARAAMAEIENFSQEQLDTLARAIGWYASNETTFTRLAQMGVDESGIGDRAGRPGKRFKIHGVLRDALRQKSTGIVE